LTAACANVLFSDWDESITEDQAKKAYDKMLKIEEEFGDLFTGLPFSFIRIHTYFISAFYCLNKLLLAHPPVGVV